MTTTCPVCEAPVIAAILTDGTTILLRPRRAPKGPVAARCVDGVWLARLVLTYRPLEPGEARYVPHERDCPGPDGGLDAWRKVAAGLAHQQRAQRGRKPRVRPVVGVRKAAPRGEQ